MDDLINRIRQVQMQAAEEAVMSLVPPELDIAQQAHEARGGCPGCGSMVLAVHKFPCSATDFDLY